MYSEAMSVLCHCNVISVVVTLTTEMSNTALESGRRKGEKKESVNDHWKAQLYLNVSVPRICSFVIKLSNEFTKDKLQNVGEKYIHSVLSKSLTPP